MPPRFCMALVVTSPTDFGESVGVRSRNPTYETGGGELLRGLEVHWDCLEEEENRLVIVVSPHDRLDIHGARFSRREVERRGGTLLQVLLEPRLGAGWTQVQRLALKN